MEEKNLYIIAGCNGAGKTTASYTILPEIIDCTMLYLKLAVDTCLFKLVIS
jgi:predicted ABC-type ATPase